MGIFSRLGRSKKSNAEEDEETVAHEPPEGSPPALVEHRPDTPNSEKAKKKQKVECGPRPPAETTEMSDDAAKVHLYVRCESLRKACRCLVAVFSKLQDETEWTEVGHSELAQESKFPNYGYDIIVPFRVYTVQLVRFEVYKVRHEVDIHNLKDHQFVGCAEINLLDAVKARASEDGWCKKPLLNPKPHAPFQGNIAVWAEEDATSKSVMNFNVKAEKLRKTDFWKPRTDGFVSIQRIEPLQLLDFADIEHFKGDCDLHQVVRTEVVRRTRRPVWNRISISVQSLCECRGKQKIVFDCWDWFRVGPPKLIGTGLMCYDEIYKNFVDSKPVALELCKRKQVPTDLPFQPGHIEEFDPHKDCRLIIDGVEVVRNYSFLDFMRSGTELVPLFAIDFTRSTGLRDAGKCSGHPFHPLPGEGDNDYAATMKALGSVLQSYNSGQKLPCYGFGAKVPPSMSICSHAFAINGDFFAPEVTGVDQAVEMYQNCLQVARLHGPTYLNPILDLALKWAAPYAEVTTEAENSVDMKYFVLVLLSDGGVMDQQECVNTLLECTALPLSVVIIEVGDNQDTFLANIGEEVKANQCLRDYGDRDFVHTTRFNDYKGNPHALAYRALYNISSDVECYFKGIDVQPRDLSKYEDDRGNPVPRPKVESAAPKQEVDLRSTAGTKESTASTPKGAPQLDLLESFQQGEKELEEAIARLPTFLQEKRLELLESAQTLGYAKTVAWRVLKDGLADASLDILVDNILHSGHGKSPTFKDAIQEVRKANMSRHTTKSRMTSKDTKAGTKSRVTTKDGASTLDPIADDLHEEHLQEVTDVADTKSLTPVDGSGTKSPMSPTSSHSHASPKGTKELASMDTRRLSSTKDTTGSRLSNGSRISKEVSFVGDREAFASKDPPSSAGGDGPVRVASSALRRKGSTKDSTGSQGSVGSDGSFRRVTLPGAVDVEYYECEPAERATTPMVSNCTICLERKINVEFVPCGHRLTCEQCADSVGQICPLCRTPLRGRKSI